MDRFKFKIFKIIFFITILSCQMPIYAGKTVNINGVVVTIDTEVVKKNIPTGGSVKDSEDFSEIENNEKTPEDQMVKIELTIKNENPYEAVNVTVSEKINKGFRQTSSNKTDKKISFKLDTKKSKTIKYNYRYDKKYISEQISGFFVRNKNNQYTETKKKDLNTDVDKNIISQNDIEKNKKNGLNVLFIIFISIVIGALILFVIYNLIKKIKENNDDNDIFGSNNFFIVVLVSGILINLLFSKTYYANKYKPIIYEKDMSYKEDITESLLFNNRYFDFSYEITIKYENKNENLDFDTDTDEDGLSDGYEYLYMTNMYHFDTDGDGLSDYDEVMIFNYNPNSGITDGSPDKYKDFDGDGLLNYKELEIGTDLTRIDTDYDGITDYDEVKGVWNKERDKKYITNPLEKDTDL